MRSGLPLLATLTLLAGCATVRVAVPVVQPPAFPLPASPQVAIDAIEGDADGSFRELIRSTLSTTRRFRLVSLEEAARTSSAILSGTVSEQTHEEVKSFDLKQGDFSGGPEIVHHFLTRTGTATLRATLRTRESTTGKPSGERTFEVTQVDVARAAPDMEPGPIAPGELIEHARQKFAAQLSAAVAPPPKTVEATFFQDEKLPALEMAITLARAGRLEEALAAITQAAEAAERSSPESPLAGMARWNRAMLEELLGRFDAARQDVQRAVRETGDAGLSEELPHIDQLERAARSAKAP